MNSPKFNQSIYPTKCLFYEDVKQFAKVYFVNAVAVRIRQSFSSPKFPVLRYIMIMLVYINHLYSVYLPIPTKKQSFLSTPAINCLIRNTLASCTFPGHPMWLPISSIVGLPILYTVYCKSFEVEKFRGWDKVSLIRWKTFADCSLQ